MAPLLRIVFNLYDDVAIGCVGIGIGAAIGSSAGHESVEGGQWRRRLRDVMIIFDNFYYIYYMRKQKSRE
jgi:hypothetical protein